MLCWCLTRAIASLGPKESVSIESFRLVDQLMATGGDRNITGDSPRFFVAHPLYAAASKGIPGSEVPPKTSARERIVTGEGWYSLGGLRSAGSICGLRGLLPHRPGVSVESLLNCAPFAAAPMCVLMFQKGPNDLKMCFLERTHKTELEYRSVS